MAKEPERITHISNGRELLRTLCEKREQEREHQQEHQAAVRDLEALGYSLEYEFKDDGSEGLATQSLAAAYLRNSLAEKVLIPVTEVWRFRCLPHLFFSEEDQKWHFEASDNEKHQHTLELLKPFTKLRIADLSSSQLTTEDLKQLNDFPELEMVILPENLLEPEIRKQIQSILPHCELKSEKEIKPALEEGSYFY